MHKISIVVIVPPIFDMVKRHDDCDGDHFTIGKFISTRRERPLSRYFCRDPYKIARKSICKEVSRGCERADVLVDVSLTMHLN